MRASSEQVRLLAQRVRSRSLQMVHRANASHIGSSLSMIDILAVLYSGAMRFRPHDPSWEGRDRLIVSKGHAAVGLYATLAEVGFFPAEHLETYGQDGSDLLGHVSHHVPGVELSTGSLGHGLPVACGLALGLPAQRVFCLVSDGELNEGSNWESILFAPAQNLANLILIVDVNGIQSFGRTDEVLPLGSLEEKFRAFRWEARTVDGHDVDALFEALRPGKGPVVVLAQTVKGKGVSYMEDRLEWHYRSPSAEQLEEALAGL